MAWAVSGLLHSIPGNNAAKVLADCRELMQDIFPVPVHRNLCHTSDNCSVAWRNILKQGTAGQRTTGTSETAAFNGLSTPKTWLCHHMLRGDDFCIALP